MTQEVPKYETSDLAIAAFLMLNEYKLISASREQSGKFRFVFNDPDRTAKSCALTVSSVLRPLALNFAGQIVF